MSTLFSTTTTLSSAVIINTNRHAVVTKSNNITIHMVPAFAFHQHHGAISPPPHRNTPTVPFSLPTETRILPSTPGDFDDDLTCTLAHMPIPTLKSATVDANDLNKKDSHTRSKVLPYEALSYCWYHSIYIYGEARLPDGVIICDGVEVVIGGELHSAL